MHSEPVITLDVDRLALLRHRLHRIPELAYEEFETAAVIREELKRFKIEFVAGVPDAPTATIGMIGDRSLPCIALRADMDGLPIAEQTRLPYASQRAGRMHACGHDGHIAMLIGAAEVLAKQADQLSVCVKVIFQPAEEGGGGAARLIDAGVLDGTVDKKLGPKVKAIYGLHGWPTLPVGVVSSRAGAILAATDAFTVRFIGRGCHGAFPHLGVDPIVTAAEAVVNLQQFVSREMDPTEPAVVTVAKFHAGTATNVIPDVAEIAGTARTLSPVARVKIAAAIRRRCEHIAAAGNCRVDIEWLEGYPPTINDPSAFDYVAKIARGVVGPDRFIPAAGPAMGGEDFAYYLEKVPGCFFFVGICPPDRESFPPLHSDRFDFNDAALGVGVRMLVNLAKHS